MDTFNTTKLAILYVEDDELTRRSVTNRLQRRGFEVLSAESGERALEIVKERAVLAGVLMDIDLPGMDGLETYVCLQETFAGLPLVICSGAISPVVSARIERMGIPKECCLCKPCPFGNILAAIDKVTSTQSSIPGR
tara:strand:+ start:989 stop:1399 length:411 start_codon:yes stop_codon:yes gene_type:complete